ncbi:hypothetical protein LCGC14_1259410 [marine sediment metagenome]|uniref:Uncharacterized protein n=1 Tax=marine sediment metagenome TaxID=412755 RepID=A0A0F9L179_9ZZZZ
MEVCCSAHLTIKVRDCSPRAENGEVTVTVIEHPITAMDKLVKRTLAEIRKNKIPTETLSPPYEIPCEYCKAPAEFAVSYHPKKESGE